LPVSKKNKNIIGAKLIFGRFGLPCLPVGKRLPCLRQAGLPTGRQASSVPISEENKATSAIADIHTYESSKPHFLDSIQTFQ